VIERRDGEVVVDGSVREATEITPENAASFHFHGDRDAFPLTAVLLWPRDAKSATILKGRYAVRQDAQALVPRDVVEELLGFVFRLKRFFDANAVLVAVATALFLGLIVVLSLRLRQREFETLWKIGCSRGTVFSMQATELFLVLLGGALLASGAVALLLALGVEARLMW
jgi:putative ABC transport system permease protein